jgi:hypothetical protein
VSEQQHLFQALLDFALALGAKSIKDLPGCWERSWRHDNKDWVVAIHGSTEPRKCSTGAEIPPYTFYVECNGWPAGLVDPTGWTIAAGSCINETALRSAIAGYQRVTP